jgi:hypothetical protein
MTAFNVFYLLVFSALAHKEMRFLLPILPFAMIMCAAQVVSIREKYPSIDYVVKLYFFAELAVLGYLTSFHQRAWEVPAYLINKPEPIQSLVSLERFDAPYYSWFHTQGANKTQLHLPDRNPQFALL